MSTLINVDVTQRHHKLESNNILALQHKIGKISQWIYGLYAA